ncbi:MAG: hypothetical protein ACI9KM_001818 [Rubritalea sp.]|jgi:hypothetical protein
METLTQPGYIGDRVIEVAKREFQPIDSDKSTSSLRLNHAWQSNLIKNEQKALLRPAS